MKTGWGQHVKRPRDESEDGMLRMVASEDEMLYPGGNGEPLKAFEQGSLLLRFLFLDPLGCCDLSAVRKGEGMGAGERKWGRGCPLELWEPAGGA